MQTENESPQSTSNKIDHRQELVEKPDEVPISENDMRRWLQQVLIEFHDFRALIDDREKEDAKQKRGNSPSPPMDSATYMTPTDIGRPPSGRSPTFDTRFKRVAQS